MKKDIFLIYNIFLKTGTQTIDNVSFTNKDKAIEYIESKLTKEEILKTRNAKNRNLISWYEFLSKDYNYYIKVVSLIGD